MTIRLLECEHCRHVFRHRTDGLAFVVCPNCGHVHWEEEIAGDETPLESEVTEGNK